MYKKILIAIDDSVIAFGALEQGLALAQALKAKATVVTATEPWTSVVTGDAAIAFPVDEYERSVERSANELLSRAEDAAAKLGIPCNLVHMKDAYPADGILAAANEHDSDLIVMGSHGRRGITRLLLGSQANQVVTQSTIPVLICR